MLPEPKTVKITETIEKVLYVAEDGRRFTCSTECCAYVFRKYYDNITDQLEFIVKEKHIKLLKNINFEFHDRYCSIELSQEFPFHTDKIPDGIVEILGEKDALEYVRKVDEDENEDVDRYYMTVLQFNKMVAEVYICLKILLKNCEIKCGLYKKSCSYEDDYSYICK